MNVVCVVQARLGSIRLPRKILADIAGRPMLEHVLERAKAIEGVAAVVLAVPRTDVELGFFWAGPTRFGSPIDVLSRFWEIAKEWEADAVVRLTGDCPLLAPEFASDVLSVFQEQGADYCTNVGEHTDGLDVEVMSKDALYRASREAQTPHDLEHVTAIMRERLFPYPKVLPPDWWPGPKLSVDTQEDLDRVREMSTHLESGKFSLRETLKAWEKAGRP